MFKQLFKPKWQHANPEVRKQALENMDASELDILREVATQDSEPRLRCLAVRKINDLETLKELSQEGNSNWEVSQLARQRFHNALAGQLDSNASLETRLQYIREMQDNQDFMTHLLREAKDVEIRALVLEHVEDEALLAEVAQNDPASQLRLQAAERLQSEELLDQVAKQVRNRDKRVYRLLKDRLDALQEARERPLRLRAERAEICKRMELLLKANDWDGGDSAETHPELQHLRKQWDAVEGEPEADQQQQGQQLFAECATAWRQFHEQKVQREAIRQKKQSLLSDLRHIHADLSSAQQLKQDQAKSLQLRLDGLQQAWQHADKLPEHEEQNLSDTFSHQQHEARSRIKELMHHLQIADALEKVCRRAERMLKDNKVVQRDTVKQLEQAWQAVEQIPSAQSFINPIVQRFHQAKDTLNKRRETQMIEREANQKKLNDTMSELEKALAEGLLHEAKPLAESAEQLLGQLELDKSQYREIHNHLQEVNKQLRELDSWQRWGNAREREQLCELVEELINSEDHPENLARQIQNAQAEWQKLSHQDHSNALWHRFHKACQEAYKPCQAYFEEQASERRDNLSKREALCEELERLELETDWNTPPEDWRSLYQNIQAQRKAWFNLGPTDRKMRKRINERFEKALAALDKHLDQERQQNMSYRQGLLEEVQSLLEAEDLGAAIKRVKLIQREWHITVPASRKDERQLWNRFHSACDAVFERQRNERREHEQEQEQNLEAKNALCERLEQLAAGGALQDAQAQIYKAEEEWEAIGLVPKKALRGVEKRFEKARRSVGEAQVQHQLQQKRAQLDDLQARAALCVQLERCTSEQYESTLSGVQNAWEALGAPEASKDLSKVQQRFAQACAGPVNSSAGTMALVQAELEELCLRMELLAGIDSPPDYAAARMAYQVQRLSQAMGGGKVEQSPKREAEQVEKTWYATGPVTDVDLYPELETRFLKALQVFNPAPVVAAAAASAEKNEESE